MSRAFLGLLVQVGFLLTPGILLHAEEPTFAIQIVGSAQFQQHDFTDLLAASDAPVARIAIPREKAELSSQEPDDPTSTHHFYVLLRNNCSDPIRLNLAYSDWYPCLVFHISTTQGSKYEIRRPPTAWHANPMRSWIFEPGGFKIFLVDFTTGRWEGFPSEKQLGLRAQYQISASFQYYDWAVKKLRTFEGPTVTAMNE